MIHIAFGNYIEREKIVAVATPKGAPILRAVRTARQNDLIIDMTQGRKTKAIIFTVGGYIILTALAPETINKRLNKSNI